MRTCDTRLSNLGTRARFSSEQRRGRRRWRQRCGKRRRRRERRRKNGGSGGGGDGDNGGAYVWVWVWVCLVVVGGGGGGAEAHRGRRCRERHGEGGRAGERESARVDSLQAVAPAREEDLRPRAASAGARPPAVAAPRREELGEAVEVDAPPGRLRGEQDALLDEGLREEQRVLLDAARHARAAQERPRYLHVPEPGREVSRRLSLPVPRLEV